tara:strand:+ start:49 stop:1050 length:1002 start_codon:yes stop_codon:yes gene_type:complete
MSNGYKGLNIDQAIELNRSQMPNQTYNMWAVAGAAVPSAVLGVDAFIKNRKAKTDLKKQQGYVDTLMKNYMETPIYNPYENLSVATQANQIKMEETDKALANTLDTLRAQGASAGGATALAQAALRSKAGIAADIEKQEVFNERLKAQGEIMVQNAEMQRKGQQMDYEQSKADQLRMEQFAYGERAADMAGALGSLGLQAARGLGSGSKQGSQVRRDQSLIDSQIATGNQVTSGVDVDELTRSQPQSIEEQMNLDIFDEQDQPVIEDLGYMGSVTGNQAVSAFPGKGLMQVDQARPGQIGSMGYVTINGERVPYEELQDAPGGVGKIMKRKTY